jgi:hypothetical protein
MRLEAQAKLDGMSWDWREATLDLLAIAQGKPAPFTTSRPVAIIRSKGYAVLADGQPRLTAVGLDYLRKTFS